MKSGTDESSLNVRVLRQFIKTSIGEEQIGRDREKDREYFLFLILRASCDYNTGRLASTRYSIAQVINDQLEVRSLGECTVTDGRTD